MAATVDQLRAALEQAGVLVTGIRPEQWAAATPCDGWDVRTLVSHLITGNRVVAAAIRGDQPAQPEADDDLVTAFAQSADEPLTAFAGPGVLQQLVATPFGVVPGEVALHLRITETLTHGWDLARATGQHARFDGAVAAQEIEFSRGAIGAIPGGRRPFGPSQPAPADATPLDHLAALLGRKIAESN